MMLAFLMSQYLTYDSVNFIKDELQIGLKKSDGVEI